MGPVVWRAERVAGPCGRPADLPDRRAVVAAGDTIPLGHKTLRVVELRDGGVDEDPVLVVGDVSE
jgi:hypothetical protein